MKEKTEAQIASLTQTRDALVNLRTALKNKINNILKIRCQLSFVGEVVDVADQRQQNARSQFPDAFDAGQIAVAFQLLAAFLDGLLRLLNASVQPANHALRRNWFAHTTVRRGAPTVRRR